jgi:hypothetical protein
VTHRVVLVIQPLRNHAAVALATGLLCLIAVIYVGSAHAAGLGGTLGSQQGIKHPAASATQDPWTHDRQVIANLIASPPPKPIVCILGGSSARECTVSETEWASQVQALGSTVSAYNLGSSNRTLAESIALMKALPAGKLKMIVFIAVNLGCFESSEPSATVTLPAPVFPLPAWTEHLRSQSSIWSTAAKRSAVTWWLKMRYPPFKADYNGCAIRLERLIKVCKSRGLYPVLIDMPRNMQIIGHALDAPISRFRHTCSALKKKYSIPFVGDFNRSANLVNSDFFDNWHLVEPGRVKWQDLLSKKTEALLEAYGLSSGSGTGQ